MIKKYTDKLSWALHLYCISLRNLGWALGNFRALRAQILMALPLEKRPWFLLKSLQIYNYLRGMEGRIAFSMTPRTNQFIQTDGKLDGGTERQTYWDANASKKWEKVRKLCPWSIIINLHSILQKKKNLIYWQKSSKFQKVARTVAIL